MDNDTARLLRLLSLRDEITNRLNLWYGLSTNEVDDIPDRIDSMQLDDEDIARLRRTMAEGNIINRIDEMLAEFHEHQPPSDEPNE